MPQRRVFFIAALLLSALFAVPLGAQPSAQLPIAAVTDENIWVYGLDGDQLRLTNARAQEGFFDPVWSPDGSLLAFVGVNPASGMTSLYATNLRTALLSELVSGLHPQLPVSFTPDGSALIYTTPVSNDLVQVMRYQPAAGQAPTTIGTFNITTNCAAPPGQPLPTDFHYGRETGSMRFPRYVLAMMPFGLLHSNNCFTPDLWLMNPQNGQDTQIFASVDGVFISPDNTRAVVVQDNMLTFVNTERGPYTQIIPPAQPDQVGFGLAGSNEIFYSARESLGATPLPEGAGEALGNVYFQMPFSYRTSIHRFSLRTGRDEVVYEADVFGIGNITLMSDGDTLIFSQIANPDEWVQAVADGEVRPEDLRAAERYITTEVYALSLSTGEARRLGRGWHDVAVNTAAEIAVPASPMPTVPPPTFTPIPVQPTATLPPTLTPVPDGVVIPTVSDSGIGIGLTMRVSPQINALNVRRRPGTGSPVVEVIYSGVEVTVLDGPVDDAEGFRWWQVSIPSGAQGWVAERVGGTVTLVPVP